MHETARLLAVTNIHCLTRHNWNQCSSHMCHSH